MILDQGDKRNGEKDSWEKQEQTVFRIGNRLSWKKSGKAVWEEKETDDPGKNQGQAVLEEKGTDGRREHAGN